jgi:hypothetical protein
LRAAVLCDRVLTEQDGVHSLVRVIDQFVVTAAGPEAPTSIPPGQIRQNLYLSFVAGDAKGRLAFAIRPEKPSGEQLPAQNLALTFDGRPNHINNVVVDFQIEIDQEGLWWFDVMCEGAVLGRIPLVIVYQRIG